MTCLNRMPRRPLGFFLLALAAAVLSGGCSGGTHDPGVPANPLAVYTTTGTRPGLPTDGATTGVGAIDQPIVTVPIGNDGRRNHSIAPLLDNWHPGWQQAECLSCHTDQSRIPDHSYADTSLCFLCHGTNGLPGFGDNVPPVVRGVVASPNRNGVLITWTTDELTITRLILRTTAGDRMEFPVSSDFARSHKFTMTGLLSATTYEYEILAIDKNGNRTTTTSFGRLFFTTLPAQAVAGPAPGPGPGPEPPPTAMISGPFVSDIGQHSVTVRWTTAEPTTCTIEFVDMLVGRAQTLPAGGHATEFSRQFLDLIASRTYRVSVTATTATGERHTSRRVTFTTRPLD